MRDSPNSVMLFAAGFGTRMGALTKSTPKPLIRVAGKALLDHSLALTEGMGLRRVVNTHYLGKQIADHLSGTDVLISDETGEILETGGGLKAALPMLGSAPVFTMNTDAIWVGPNPLEQLKAHWDPNRMDALLMCVPRDQAVGFAGRGNFVIGSDGRLQRGDGDIYGGIQIMKTEGLGSIQEPSFSLNMLWDRMLDEDRVFGMRYSGRWCDVGTAEGITLAEEMLARDV